MKTFTRFLGMVLVMGLFAATYVSQSTYDAPVGNFVGTPEEIGHQLDVLEHYKNIPTLTRADKRAFPGCVDITAPRRGFWSALVVVTLDGSRRKVAFDNNTIRWIKSNHDVWVIGKCR